MYWRYRIRGYLELVRFQTTLTEQIALHYSGCRNELSFSTFYPVETGTETKR